MNSILLGFFVGSGIGFWSLIGIVLIMYGLGKFK